MRKIYKAKDQITMASVYSIHDNNNTQYSVSFQVMINSASCPVSPDTMVQVEMAENKSAHTIMFTLQFSVAQIEYPLGGSSKKGSHVYFLLIVAMVLQL